MIAPAAKPNPAPAHPPPCHPPPCHPPPCHPPTPPCHPPKGAACAETARHETLAIRATAKAVVRSFINFFSSCETIGRDGRSKGQHRPNRLVPKRYIRFDVPTDEPGGNCADNRRVFHDALC